MYCIEGEKQQKVEGIAGRVSRVDWVHPKLDLHWCSCPFRDIIGMTMPISMDKEYSLVMDRMYLMGRHGSKGKGRVVDPLLPLSLPTVPLYITGKNLSTITATNGT